jgi:cobalt/nickel transport system ATP-binding protein
MQDIKSKQNESNLIELRGITYAYRETSALDDVVLSIAEGESVALIGPNGSGKSTLLKLLNGIIFPSAGSYRFDGEEIGEKRLRDPMFAKRFHQRVGFVFQNPDAQLFCANVYEEIAFGPRQMHLPEDEVDRRVDDCLELLGIVKLRHREPYHLSEGEKRKVAIACVLSLNPEVLTLDEPMDGLDPRTKRFLRDFLAEINRAGKTVICATHEFGYIDGAFRRGIVFGEDHQVVRDGDLGEILADGEFMERFNLK